MVLFCKETANCLSVSLHVQPRAKKTEILGMHGDCLKIKVAAPPVDGAANDEIIRFFSKLLGVSRSSVEIKTGDKSRRKTVLIQGVSVADFTSLLIQQGYLKITLG